MEMKWPDRRSVGDTQASVTDAPLTAPSVIRSPGLLRTHPAMRSPTARRRAVAVLLGLAALALPASVVAHPLGNFTINHYAALRVAPDQVALDVVVDLAEIPAFQARIGRVPNATRASSHARLAARHARPD